jgi:putative intracellular protease/amidase
MVQKVGVLVPGDFNARALRKLLEGLLDKGATHVSVFLSGATEEGVRLAQAAALLADPERSRVSVYWLYEDFEEAMQGVVKFIALGGWDPQAILAIPDELWNLLRQVQQNVNLVASLGNGLLPFINAGLVPQGAQVAAPPDDSYVETCQEYGLDPVTPQEWDTDEEGRPLYTPPGVYWEGEGWGLFTSSIPDYLYEDEEEEEFGELYDEEIEQFIDALERAFYGELEPGVYQDLSQLPEEEEQLVLLVVPPQASLPRLSEWVDELVYGRDCYVFIQAPEEMADDLTVHFHGESSVEVLPQREEPDTPIDKVIVFGGFYWYSLVYEEHPPEETEELFIDVLSAVDKTGFVAAVGSGTYPLIMGRRYPSGSQVAMWKSPEDSLAEERMREEGVEAFFPTKPPLLGLGGEELDPVTFTFWRAADGKGFFTAAFPDPLLAGHWDVSATAYRDLVRACVDYLEQAYAGKLPSGWTLELPPADPWEALGPPPKPSQALVVILPSFHDDQLRGVTGFLDGEGVPWTLAAWDEARGASLRQCSPPAFRGQYGTSIQPDIWAWCAKESDYDVVFLIGSTRMLNLFPCRGGPPSQAKGKLFDLLGAFVAAGKPIFALGSAPVMLGEAGLADGVLTCICDTTRRGDLMGCLTDNGSMVLNPPGAWGVPFPAEVWDDGVFDEGIATFYCQEQTKWSATDLGNLKTALHTLYEIALRWVQVGSPADWRPHTPQW